MDRSHPILADRLGLTVHVSPLRFKLKRLSQQFPSKSAMTLEDWLVDVANARGARVVERPGASVSFAAPPLDTLSNEELVVGICQLQCLDRPQMLRLAAQLISRGALDVKRLRLVAVRERVERVLGELTRQALRVEPAHPVWRQAADVFAHCPPLRDSLLHWTRLADPIMQKGRPNAIGWKLVV